MSLHSETDPFFLHEVNIRRPFKLYGLTLSVEEGEHEVEEVALAKVRGRLLLIVGPTQSDTA